MSLRVQLSECPSVTILTILLRSTLLSSSIQNNSFIRLIQIIISSIIENKESDTFFMGFNTYLFLRTSCYSCKYVGTERIADITLADFWGVDLSKLSDEQRKNGVSLIIANSDKGKGIIPQLKKDMVIMLADKERAIPANQALTKPGTINGKRADFFNKIHQSDFDVLIHKYNKKSYFKLRVRSILGDRLYEFLKKVSGRVEM